MKNNEAFANKILEKYIDTFGELPPTPMMQCSGERDPKYLKMCMDALKIGKKITVKDLSKYFPMEKGNLY